MDKSNFLGKLTFSSNLVQQSYEMMISQSLEKKQLCEIWTIN